MKKPSRREQLSEPAPRSKRIARRNEAQEGRWEFITSGSIFALGSNETARRAAYRTAAGELRFLPL
jgi:hypothetical protein